MKNMRTNLTLFFLLMVAIVSNAQNPYLPLWEYIPDGEPYVFEDPDRPGEYRVYIYGSHDVMKDAYCGRDQVLWSASVNDLSNWRYDGVIFENRFDRDGRLLNSDSTGDVLYAPDVAMRVENGKKVYYFFPNIQGDERCSLIARSDRPDGPFVPCNWSKTNPRLAEGVLGFDPAVFIDDDGRVYGYWGINNSYMAELEPTTMASIKPGCQVLKDVVSGTNQEGEFHFFEASSMRKIKDKYILIYSSMLPEGMFGFPPSNYNLAWAYAESPLGPFMYGGILIDARALATDPKTGKMICTAHPYGNTHGSIAEINGQWWVFFHRQTGVNEYSRQAMVAPITVEVEEGRGGKVRISQAEYTSEGFAIEGLNPLHKTAAGWACYLIEPKGVVQEYPNFYHSGSYIQSTRLEDSDWYCPVVNNTAGSVVGYKYFNMDITHTYAHLNLLVHLRPQGRDGVVRVFMGAPTMEQGGVEIGQIRLSRNDEQQIREYVVHADQAISFTGKQPLFFVFQSKEQGVSLCELYDFQFEKPTNPFISCNNMDKTIDSLYRRMTLKERVAQLHGQYLGDYFLPNGQLDTAKCERDLIHGAGHFSQFAVSDRATPEQMRDKVNTMQAWLQQHTRIFIPALFHEEVLSGIAAYGATVYPQQIGLACSFNPALAEVKTYQTAGDLRMIGGCLALSPMVDVVRDPSFCRLEESYGEDAYLSSVMGVAFVKGLQHDDLHEGVAACTKHFLGYGGGGDAPLKERMEEILMPHAAIMRCAHSQALMPGYHTVDGVQMVANKHYLTDIARDYLHFDGVIVSDYGAIEQNEAEPDTVHRAAAALKAGNDVDFPSGNAYKYLPQALEQGLITEADIERAVKAVLRLKYRLGLLDSLSTFHSPLSTKIEWDRPEEQQTSYELATQSVVLLQNNGVLPLAGKQKIALVGPNANTMWAMLGDYTYHAMRYFWQMQEEDAFHPVIHTLLEGLQQGLPKGSRLNYSRGCDWTDTLETIIAEGGDSRAEYMRRIQGRQVKNDDVVNRKAALRLAKQSDVIIAAMGENVMLCGENRDRKTLRLPGSQEQFVKELIATGKPVVLVVFGGRAQVISSIAKDCAAIIQAWYPGEMGGIAVADILYGKVVPSGKLSVTYPAVELHEPICYNYGLLPNDERVAWPFGYGLSYTTFAYSNLQLPKEVKTSSKYIDLSLEVTNTGKVDGDEIVQVYLSPIDKSMKHKPIQLKGFARVSVPAGETRPVQVRLYTEQFGYWTPEGWIVESGRFLVKVGASSQDIRLEQEVVLTGKTLIKPLREHYLSE